MSFLNIFHFDDKMWEYDNIRHAPSFYILWERREENEWYIFVRYMIWSFCIKIINMYHDNNVKIQK